MPAKAAAPAEELIDQVDEEDRVLGQVPRLEAYARRANFRVVHVFLFDPHGRLLLHQLSDAKKTHPGAWGSSVAGAVRAGETPAAAARRELREELGVRGARLRYLGKTRLDDAGVTKFLSLFAAVHERGDLRPDPAEIAAVEFLPVGEVRRLLSHRERRFTPTFQSAFTLFERGAIA